MTAHILLIIVSISAIQSMFGAGVLLFGTPLLLFFGHDFIDVLLLLLPISIAINLLQIQQHYRLIDFGFYRKVVVLTLPPIALFLFLITHIRINISLIIGLFLFLIAAKEFSTTIADFINRLMRYEKVYFVTMGIVHGVSNLGGSLLTALVHHKDYPKEVVRVTIAACYATFALIQLLVLALFNQRQIQMSLYDNFMYLVVGSLIFIYVDAVFYQHLKREKYRYIFAGFLALCGLVLVTKAFS